MNKKPEENAPEVTTPYHIAVLILLWLFILMWISPLASLAAPSAGTSDAAPACFSRSIDSGAVAAVR